MTPWHLMRSTATVQQGTPSVDAAGAPVLTYSGGSSVRCRVQDDNSTAGREYERVTGRRRSTGFFARIDTAGAAISIGKDARVTVDGTVYRAIGDALNPAGASWIQTVSLEVIT